MSTKIESDAIPTEIVRIFLVRDYPPAAPGSPVTRTSEQIRGFLRHFGSDTLGS